MVRVISDNILSPLGETTEKNYEAVKSGSSAIRRYERCAEIPESFTASIFTQTQNNSLSIDGLTRFESLVVNSIKRALTKVDINISDSKTIFILSTTKANIDLLNDNPSSYDHVLPGNSAKRICSFLGISTPPIVVCNACISGLSAIILAKRLLDNHDYDYAIVCGADVLNSFVISGFRSLKALSAFACKPYDIERLGLNLGEAASSLILTNKEFDNNKWSIVEGVIRNDAYHISTPSKNGEGAYRALQYVLKNESKENLAIINAHGTATMFNDQMESIAIERAGLSAIPVNSLKGFFGHTLGAAGVLETVLTIRSIDDHLVLGTHGFEEIGVSGKINVASNNLKTNKTGIVKMLSGFGGCNASISVKRSQDIFDHDGNYLRLRRKHHVLINPSGMIVDGRPVYCKTQDSDFITDIYKIFVNDYPRFYKMDMLSRLGFVASELLISYEGKERFLPDTNRAIVLFNRSSSFATDKDYWETIKDPEDCYPSPSLFVYTLPNIVTGEIAIRNCYYGETSFYILVDKNEMLMEQIQKASFNDKETKSIISGWVDYEDSNHFEADIYLIETD